MAKKLRIGDCVRYKGKKYRIKGISRAKGFANFYDLSKKISVQGYKLKKNKC
jgi:hypothetical protein